MKYYARINSGIVNELLVLDDVVDINKAFHKNVAATLVPCKADVQEQWTYADGVFSPPVPPALSKDVLRSHAFVRQTLIVSNGVTVTINAKAHHVDTDAKGLAYLDTAYVVASSGPILWVDDDGTNTPLSLADVSSLKAGASAFIQSTYTVLASVLTAIAAGTITTREQIDAATWPSN